MGTRLTLQPSGAGAEGFVERQIGTEAHAESPFVCACRRLDQNGIHQRCSGGIANQHRGNIVGQTDFFLHIVAEILKISRAVSAAFH